MRGKTSCFSSSFQEKNNLGDVITQLEYKVATLEHQNAILKTNTKDFRREIVSFLSEVFNFVRHGMDWTGLKKSARHGLNSDKNL